MNKFWPLLGTIILLAGVESAPADTALKVVIKDHVFQPAEIHIKADDEVTLTVDNQDATPEEFESHDLRIEKVVPGNSTGVVRFGPLKPGTYEFVGEYNEKTAKGKLIVK